MYKKILLDIVKNSINSKFDKNITINKDILIKQFSFLNEKKATFVTLYLDNNLRGCIGTLYANRRLIDDLINNAYMAAFEDPRFYELSYEEFLKVSIEISILTSPIEILYDNFEDLEQKIKPNIDGVILEDKGRRSTFLPQVWEQLPLFQDFFAHLCHKGSFEIDKNFKPKVYVYQVEKIK